MLNTENEKDHFLKNRNLYKWDIHQKNMNKVTTTSLIHIHIYAVNVLPRGWYCQYKAINSLQYEQGHSIKDMLD